MPAQGIQPGDVVSLFLFLDDAAVARPVWCLDNAPATNGLSVCQPLTFAPGDTPVDPSSGIAPYASWRFGNLSPDAMESAVDVCVKPTSYPSWDVGDKQAAFKDIPYKAITGNKPSRSIPTGTT